MNKAQRHHGIWAKPTFDNDEIPFSEGWSKQTASCSNLQLGKQTLMVSRMIVWQRPSMYQSLVPQVWQHAVWMFGNSICCSLRKKKKRRCDACPVSMRDGLVISLLFRLWKKRLILVLKIRGIVSVIKLNGYSITRWPSSPPEYPVL